jgi:hypothetical protein
LPPKTDQDYWKCKSCVITKVIMGKESTFDNKWDAQTLLDHWSFFEDIHNYKRKKPRYIPVSLHY